MYRWNSFVVFNTSLPSHECVMIYWPEECTMEFRADPHRHTLAVVSLRIISNGVTHRDSLTKDRRSFLPGRSNGNCRAHLCTEPNDRKGCANTRRRLRILPRDCRYSPPDTRTCGRRVDSGSARPSHRHPRSRIRLCRYTGQHHRDLIE